MTKKAKDFLILLVAVIGGDIIALGLWTIAGNIV